jgi:putative aminopeptidase FrvX
MPFSKIQAALRRTLLVLACLSGTLPASAQRTPEARPFDRVETLLADLTDAFGPSGFEEPVRAIVRRELGGITRDIETDGLGSVIARLDGAPEGPRVMLAAHMDEVGMLVRHITDEGYVKFEILGGMLEQAIINQRYLIRTRGGYVQAVAGLKTPHVMSAEERVRLRTRDDLFLDVGAASARDAGERLGIRLGDPIAPDSRFAILNNSKLYVAKAWDDRVGCALLLEVMRRLKDNPPPNRVHMVFTVQEEIGLRGARTSSYLVRPEVGISIESGVAADYPGIGPDEAQERLGKGPGMFLHDSSMLPNLKLRDLVIDVAKREGIPLQFNVLRGYGEDGAEMQRSYGGAPTVNLTVPTRYLHNHNGIIHRDDFDRAVELVTALVRSLDGATVARLKTFE